MLPNYLRTAYRTLWKNKLFSLISIAGLALSMAACLLIFQYVSFELSYDDFHEKADRIYRLTYSKDADFPYHTAMNVPAAGPALYDNSPEIQNFARLYPFARYQFACAMLYDHKGVSVTFNEPNLYYADTSFLSVFSFSFIKGNASTALLKPYTAVITASTAKRYFGKADPLGKTLSLISSTEAGDYTVTGVIEDIPQNSHLALDILLSYPSLSSYKEAANEWQDDIAYTYLLLSSGAKSETLVAKFSGLIESHFDPANHIKFGLQSLTDIHLHSNLQEEIKAPGNVQAVYYLMAVAIFILLIAWVNYINLTTAKSVERAKEVGIRKVSGASRLQLMVQFLIEAFIINGIGIALVMILVQLSLPVFYQISGISQPDNLVSIIMSNREQWLLLLAIFWAGIILVGIYPAFIVSSFRPAHILKGKFSGERNGLFLRKGLVVFQFAISIGLIVSLFAFYQQFRFMQNQDIGIDISQTLVIKAPGNIDSLYIDRLNSFKQTLGTLSAVQYVTTSSNIPGKEVSWTGEVRRDGLVKNFSIQVVDTDFIKAYRLKVLAGRDFLETEQPKGRFGSKVESVILNEEAVRQLGFKHGREAIGATVYWNNNSCVVVGVVNNFHQRSPAYPLQPTIFLVNNRDSIYYSVKLNVAASGQTDNTQIFSSAISFIQSQWNKSFPDNPFDYFILEDSYHQQYQADEQLSKLFSIFCGLAIFIACLGLFGLSSFTIVQRTKEIGIRKVLGASVSSITALLSQDFIRLILVAGLIALPIAYFAMQQWLANYAFRITISWWMLLLPVAAVLLLAMLTIGFQTIRAARANPVDSLRYE